MLTLEALRQQCSDGERFEYLFFWGHQPSKTGKVTQSCFSQWFAAPFTIDGTLYPTARLFDDEVPLAQILGAQGGKSFWPEGEEPRRGGLESERSAFGY